jgi:hypothetical protein
MHRKVKEVDGGLLKFTTEQLFLHITGACPYARGLLINHLIQPVRVNAPCSHTSAHEVVGPELERIFDAPSPFAACRHYSVKMAS